MAKVKNANRAPFLIWNIPELKETLLAHFLCWFYHPTWVYPCGRKVSTRLTAAGLLPSWGKLTSSQSVKQLTECCPLPWNRFPNLHFSTLVQMHRTPAVLPVAARYQMPMSSSFKRSNRNQCPLHGLPQLHDIAELLEHLNPMWYCQSFDFSFTEFSRSLIKHTFLPIFPLRTFAG